MKCSTTSQQPVGQKAELPPPPFDTCVLPFNKLHISVEGYIKACCNATTTISRLKISRR